MCHPLAVPHLLEQTLRWSDEALRRADRAGDPVLAFFTRTYRSTIMPIPGQFDEWDRCLAETGELADRLDQPIIRWAHTFLAGARAQTAGDLDRADELALQALEIGTACGQPDAVLFYAATVIVTAWHRGDFATWLPMWEQICDEFPDQLSFTPSLAFAYVRLGRRDEAYEIFERAAAAEFILPLDIARLGNQVTFADLTTEFRAVEPARLLLERLAPFAELVPDMGLGSSHPVTHALGGLATVLGRQDDADSYFAKCGRALRTAPYEILRDRERSGLGHDAPRT